MIQDPLNAPVIFFLVDDIVKSIEEKEKEKLDERCKRVRHIGEIAKDCEDDLVEIYRIKNAPETPEYAQRLYGAAQQLLIRIEEVYSTNSTWLDHSPRARDSPFVKKGYFGMFDDHNEVFATRRSLELLRPLQPGLNMNASYESERERVEARQAVGMQTT